MWKGLEGDEVERDLARVQVAPEHVSIVAAVLMCVRCVPAGIRAGAISGGLYAAGVTDPALAEAAFTRLRAAALLGLGPALDAYAGEPLTDAIAMAPLHPVGVYYYFDPEEFMNLLEKSGADGRARRGA